LNKPENWLDLNLNKPNLLFGNGLGRTYWEAFGYKSLLDVFGDRPVGRYLCTKELFDKLKTSNFEEVLRAIYHAYLVSIDNLDATKTLYVDVQKALISAVNSVHPKHAQIPNEEIAECFCKYKGVFTTDYDLLPYWAILSGYSQVLVDFFWGGKFFDSRRVGLFEGKIPVYFLHGALHLRSKNISDTEKIPITLQSEVEGALELDFEQSFPLFITEGNYKQKLNRIKSNSYLNFCYQSLCQTYGELDIYGHDLNQDFDRHIIDAIRQSDNERIAVGVLSRLSAPEKKLFMGRIRSLFSDQNRKIDFYESNTHPFATVAHNNALQRTSR